MFDIFLCVLISILVVLLSFFIFKSTFGTMNIKYYMPHMHLFYYQMLIMCMVGSVLMYSGLRSQAQERFGITEHSVWVTSLCVWYVFLVVPISIYVFFHKLGKDKKDYIKIYYSKKIHITDTEGIRFFAKVCMVFCIGCVLYLYYVDAPIFQLLKGNIGRVLISRVDYGRNFGGSYLIKNVFCESLAVLISYIMFVFAVDTKEKFWKKIFIVTLVCGIVISGASLSKSGVINYLIVFIFLYVACGKKISIGKYIKYVLVGLILLLTFYSIQTSGKVSVETLLTDFWAGPIGRILFMQIQSMPAYFMIFPHMHSYTYGQGIALLRFVGFEHVEAARVVATYLEPEGVAQGWVGVANTLFIGDAYANFGWLGIVLSPIIVGFWIAFFTKKLCVKEKNAINVAAYIMILDNLVKSFTGGFCSAYILNTKIITILMFVVLYNRYIDVIRKKSV